MDKLFIIKTGTTFENTAREYGDFDDWTLKMLAVSAGAVEVIDAEHGDPLPELVECGGLIITGSHAMVTEDLDWSVEIESWIPQLVRAEIPLLGICYGHQLMARALGGTVGYHPEGKEIGTVNVDLLPAGSEDVLLSAMPDRFPAHVTHSQSVLSLPPGAVRLASNGFEPNHAFRMGKCAWGVQFHPEYDAAIMASYIQEQAAELEEAGRDVREILSQVRETPGANDMLRRFGEIVEQRSQ